VRPHCNRADGEGIKRQRCLFSGTKLMSCLPLAPMPPVYEFTSADGEFLTMKPYLHTSSPRAFAPAARPRYAVLMALRAKPKCATHTTTEDQASKYMQRST
jgi:hypothetical protein